MRTKELAALALLLAIGLTLAPSASAALEQPITDFKRSDLLKGDALFKFDGRTGARYRFSPATHSRFGGGLLLVDTVDGIIVQETIVLPLPNSPRDRQMLEAMMKLYLKDTGLKKDDAAAVLAAFEEGIQGGKSQEKVLGTLFGHKYQLNVFTNPGLRSILVMVGLQQ
jgi:hypothetical protein